MEIQNLSKDQVVYNLIKKGLDASSERSKVISNNIANVNTKDFKRSYVTFEENLNNSIDNLSMKETSNMHMQDSAKYGEIDTKTDTSSSMREDGNNVDIENEMSNEAANTLMYYALISQANTRISQEKYVIDGGK